MTDEIRIELRYLLDCFLKMNYFAKEKHFPISDRIDVQKNSV